MSTTLRDRPILFSGPMVRAILEGRKTQTRRVVKPQPPADAEAVGANSYEGPEGPAWFWWKGNRDERKFWPPTTRGANSIHCPFGQPGDRLWVRESFYADARESMDGPNPAIIYAATPELAKEKMKSEVIRCTYLNQKPVGRHEASANLANHRFQKLKPSRHMPRWASRITLEITRVRVERVQDITEADAEAEGVAASANYSARDHFGRRWSELNAPRGFGWTVNPWVWVIDFERINMNASEP